MKYRSTSAIGLCLVAATSFLTPASADGKDIRVVSDIPALASIASELLQGVPHEATSLTTRGDDPHHLTLRPSQARAVSRSDVLLWVGPDLSPWMGEVAEDLGGDAIVVKLSDAEVGEGHGDHDGHDDHDDKEGHDDHDGHSDDHAEKDEHADHEDHDEHAEKDAHDDHDEHAHHGHHDGDPHHWLNLHKMEGFADRLAAVLIELAPQSKAVISKNLATVEANIKAIEDGFAAKLSELPSTSVVVLHDSYRQFTDGFGITTLSTGIGHDEVGISAKDAQQLRGFVAQPDTNCLLVPFATSQNTIATLTEGQDVHVEVLDIIGSTDTGYLNMIEKLGSGIADCLS
ncbi:metal ABC transporter solute-binding protein, Zn/Mn family [Algirhabdus cladophorae]|uniref:metal ABC transporter solute-binding protein, Zn/Mn family n=1 Tax=Algirhabdus cladophorae TaxID=3377108 RepID=UPI003B84941D